MLDLACGGGRNGLWLARQNIPVVLADISSTSLEQVATQNRDLPAELLQTWQIDLEDGNTSPLPAASFGAVIVFRYLHRPIMASIEQAVLPGGLVIYETFTEQQAHFGRPRNPDFLLRSGELPGYFPGWETLHAFEGMIESADSGNKQAIAQLVARKSQD